ncbi:MAG: PEP-CTERM sorting domain-containing protein, partial [Akkermansia sp.]|nr:PEP-CTERM sorting domain-containing protein [Akkermansia sp.]
NSSENLGAGDITLEGTTELFNYNITGTLTNNISGNKLNITNQGNVTLTGNVNLQALQMGIDTTLGDGVNERTYTLGAVTATSGTTLTVSKNATLNHLSSVTGTVTLAGSGVYDLGSGTSANVSGLTAATWTGTVRISSATDNGRIDLNALGNSSSTVALAGVYKWVDKNINVNLLLEAHDVAGEPNGFKISGTSGEGSTYNFNGNISGDGDLIIANGNNDTGHRTFKFNGDLSDWEGNLIIGVSPAANNARDATIYLTGPNSGSLVFFSSNDADCGLRVDENHHGTLTVNIGNANNSNTAVMNGTISNLVNGTAQGQLALKVVGSTAFNKDVVVTSAVVNAGKTATITGANNSITAGNVTISQKNASLSNVTVQSGSITATSTDDGATGSISDALVEMQSATSFSISDMVLSNVKLSAVEGASVALNNVSATDTLLAGGGDFTLNATPTVEVAANDTTTGRISYTCGLGVESGSSLTLNLDVINAVRPNQHGTYDLSITLSGFGSDFVIEDNAILGMVKFDASSWLAQALEEQGAEWSAEITEATENTVVTQSSVPTVTYSAGENVGTLVITINGLNVPEPTTATLSLLALAALAARRRRK